MATSRKKMVAKNSSELDENDDKVALLQVIYRSHPETSIDPFSTLAKKTKDPELLRRLLEIEQAIIKKARQKGLI